MKTPIFRRKCKLSFLLFASISVLTSACSEFESFSPTGSGSGSSQHEVEYSVIDQDRLNVLQPENIALNSSLPYPTRNDYQVKAIQTDDWSNRQDFIDANTGSIAVNFVWHHWEPALNTAACNSNIQVRFGNHCFVVDSDIDEEVRYWTNKGVIVTGIIWGVPEWARITTGCNPKVTEQKMLCVPKNSSDFGRYAGLIAQRYDGRHGNGRVADFVIHNEVNMNRWYNVGCGNGVACDVDAWVASYARDFNAAYDAIKNQQPAAKVFTSFAHQFEEEAASVDPKAPIISGRNFLQKFNPLTEGRKWRVAYHPYAPSPLHAKFGPEDLPFVTFGNIGVLAGWLRSEFPNQPESWEIHLTESGVNSLWLYSSEAEQAAGICDSFRNILGTPGVESHIYHRMVDHAVETHYGGGFGLHNEDKTPKLGWTTWSTMSGRNGNHENLDCGFENIPYTKLTSYTSGGRHPWTSSRLPPDGYDAKASWKLLRSYQENTSMLYECAIDDGSYISSDVSCGGSLTYGPVGYAYATKVDNSVGLFSCSKGSETFIATDDSCDGGALVEFLGYAIQ